MKETVLIEQTSKSIKAAELATLCGMFIALASGLGLLYIAIPLGLAGLGLAGLCFVAFCGVRIYRWWMHG